MLKEFDDVLKTVARMRKDKDKAVADWQTQHGARVQELADKDVQLAQQHERLSADLVSAARAFDVVKVACLRGERLKIELEQAENAAQMLPLSVSSQRLNLNLVDDQGREVKKLIEQLDAAFEKAKADNSASRGHYLSLAMSPGDNREATAQVAQLNTKLEMLRADYAANRAELENLFHSLLASKATFEESLLRSEQAVNNAQVAIAAKWQAIENYIASLLG